MKFKPYPRYKDSGIEWLGEVPEGWEIKRFKYLLKINPSKAEVNHFNKEIEVQFLPMELVNAGGTYELSGIRKLSEVYAGYTYCREGDVILAKITPCFENGKGAFLNKLFNGIAFGSTEFHVLRPLIIVFPKFVWYTTKTTQFRKFGELEMKGAVGQQRVPDSFIANFYVAEPALTEQTAIANFLDRETCRIDALIEEKNRFIELLKEKRQTSISHAITKGLDPTVKMKDSGVDWLGNVPVHWDIKKIKYLFEIRKRIAGEEGYPVLSITQRGIKVKDTISGEGQLAMDYSKYQFVEVGDFAMNHMDLLTGYVDISNFHGVTSPDYRVFALTDTNSVDRYFLYLMQMGYKNKIFYSYGQGVANIGRWRFQTEPFNNFSVPYPNKNEQQQIVDFLDAETSKIDALLQETQVSIELLKEHRTALISAAVTGKIDVREEK
jgi:type I restriction enzyme S subunit